MFSNVWVIKLHTLGQLFAIKALLNEIFVNITVIFCIFPLRFRLYPPEPLPFLQYLLNVFTLINHVSATFTFTSRAASHSIIITATILFEAIRFSTRTYYFLYFCVSLLIN